MQLLLSLALAAPHAWVGATVHTGTGTVHTPGVVLVDAGRIVAVGPPDAVAIPADAVVHDLDGQVVIPGLVDTHSHVGSTGDLNEMSGPLQPGVSAIDAIDPTHPSVHLARTGGITTVNIMPGSGNLIGGQTAYVKLRDAAVVDDLLFCANRRTDICGGLKMANGTNPQGGGAYPRTRMGSAYQARALWLEAKKRLDELPDPDAPPPKKKRKKQATEPPEPDLRLDPMVQALRGQRIVHHHTHRADDVITVLALAEEFGLTVVLHHVSEAWKVVDELAEAKAMCSLIVLDSPGGKEEALEVRNSNAAVLVEAGVPVSIHTDDPITDSRWFLRSAGLAVRDGLSEADALAALTLKGAEMLGLDHRIGSLEVGKDADFVVLDGPPLSVWTHVQQTVIEGEVVFDRSDPEDLPYATGGYAVDPARRAEVLP